MRDTFFLSLLRGEKPRPPRSIVERLESFEKMSSKAGRQVGLDTFIRGEASQREQSSEDSRDS